MSTKTSFLRSMAQAMARQEGFYVTSAQWRAQGKPLPPDWKKEGDPITIPQRCNNPGNLRSWAGVPSVNGYAVFPNLEAGWKAMETQISYIIYGTGGKQWPRRTSHPVNLVEFFAGQRDTKGGLLPGGYPGYAPAADRNNPLAYATFVAQQVRAEEKILFPLDAPLRTLIESLDPEVPVALTS